MNEGSLRLSRLSLAAAVPETRSNGEPSLLHALLTAQRDVTAVEAFARAHDAREQAGRYRALLPLAAPRPGEQYAFEVDLDACTGCKACVTGCHSLNALDPGEVWRTVGLLHGGTPDAPVSKTVTTACHHCLEPACMLGCPVKAYEKDPITGIVRHLDDQCIGCQYCLFMCPYDAPKMNRARGIVRKCDLCSDRLARSEAPACVQSCPNEAIRITVVDTAQAIEAAQAAAFVPGAPAPGDTLPTTHYRTREALPRNLLPADFYAVQPEHSHPALMLMLVLTQLSVGAFCTDLALGGAALEWGTLNAVFALGLGLAALGASVFHLGRPRYSYRAFLGLKTSWLSREIAAFTFFALFATLYAASFWTPRLPRTTLEPLVVASGLAGVLCSVMVYAATQRPTWYGPATAFRFFASTLVLGCATVLATALASGHDVPRALPLTLVLTTALKLTYELSLLRHLRSRHHTALKRSAILMTRDLATATAWRFVCGAVGGLAAPLLVLGSNEHLDHAVAAAFIFVASLGGELLERHLFFAAAAAPKMPGGVR
jgi:Fe-S-cluster-containing dehydrogenase component/DMSO reductase anchor subunit